MDSFMYYYPRNNRVISTCLFLLFAIFHQVFTNIDPNYPIILSNPSVNNFGYTLALADTSKEPGWIFIGSPNGTNELIKCRLFEGDEKCTVLYKKLGQGLSSFGISMSSTKSTSLTCSSFRYLADGDVDDGYCYYLDMENANNERDLRSVNFPTDYGFPEGTLRRNRDDKAPLFGFSSFLQSRAHRTSALIGVPGFKYLTGEIFIFDNIHNQGSYNQANRSNSGTLLPCQKSRYCFDDNFGYSLTGGNYFGDKQYYYATGTNMSNGVLRSGSVVYFNSFGLFEYGYLEDPETSIGSYFGSVLYSMSIMEDGKDQLFVGAPYHKGIGPKVFRLRDIGRVYIYTAESVQRVKPKLKLWKTLEPTGSQSSLFGSAITNLGDLDADDINDFAIGAPGEDDGQGAIYIYYSRDILKDLFRYKRVQASSFNNMGLRGFGSTLYGAVDIDENGTPDLAIGAYQSKQIVLLRSRPLIKMRATLQIFENGKLVSEISLKNDKIVRSIQVCIAFEQKTGSKNQNRKKVIEESLPVDWTLKADQVYKRCKNLHYKAASRRGDDIIQVQELNEASKCRNVDFEVDFGEIANFNKILNISFELEARYINPNKDFKARRLVINEDKVVQDGPRTNYNDFCKGCPNDAEITKIYTEFPINPVSDCDPKCNPKLNFLETSWLLVFAKNGSKIFGSFEFIRGNQLGIKVVIKNSGDTAENPYLALKWDTPGIRMTPKPSKSSKYNCTEKEMEIGCSLGRYPYLWTNEEARLLFRVDFSNYFASNPEEKLHLNILAESRNANTLLNSINSDLKLILNATTSNPSIFGFKSNQVIGLDVQTLSYSFDIQVNGEVAIKNISTIFLFPVSIRKNPETEFEEYFRIDASKLMDGCFVEDYKAMDNLTVESHLKQNESILYIGCTGDSNVKCAQVNCSLKNVKKERRIEFTLIVKKDLKGLNDTQSSKSVIGIESLGRVSFFGKVQSDFSTVLLQKQPEVKNIPLYILLLSVLGGVFLLILLIGILYKIGFFRRTKRDELNHLKCKHLDEGKAESVENPNPDLPIPNETPLEDVEND